MKPISCGFLIRYVPDNTYLLCHATQPKPVLEDEMWTIPKGMPDGAETFLECAVRELREETGLVLDLKSEPPCIAFDTPKKQLYIFLLNVSDRNIKDYAFRCESIIDNPDVPYMNGLPECDAYGWFTQDDCHKRVFKSLKPLFGRL